MGSSLLGNTGNPGSTHFVFFSSAGGVSFKAQGNPINVPFNCYVESIHVWAGRNSGSGNFDHAIYGTGNSLLANATINHSFGTGVNDTHSEFAAGSFARLTAGQNIVAAVSSASNVEVYGNGSGSGRDMKEKNSNTFSSPWTTDNDVTSEGDLQWYLKVWSDATITSLPTLAAAGDTITIVGNSFTSPVTDAQIGGVSCSFSVTDDTHVNVTLPNPMTPGFYTVQLFTNAGNPTASSQLLVIGLYGDNGTTWDEMGNTLFIYVDDGSAWNDFTAGLEFWIDDSSVWTRFA